MLLGSTFARWQYHIRVVERRCTRLLPGVLVFTALKVSRMDGFDKRIGKNVIYLNGSVVSRIIAILWIVNHHSRSHSVTLSTVCTNYVSVRQCKAILCGSARQSCTGDGRFQYKMTFFIDPPAKNPRPIQIIFCIIDYFGKTSRQDKNMAIAAGVLSPQYGEFACSFCVF